MDRYRELAVDRNGILVVGTDSTDVGASTELDHNLAIALDLATPVLPVISVSSSMPPGTSGHPAPAATSPSSRHLTATSACW